MLKSTVVPWDGDPDSDIWIFGEAPGAAEDRIGQVFVGPSGQYLDAAIRDAALLRPELFIWNIFSQRPPGNEIGYYFVNKEQTGLTDEGQRHVDRVREMLEKHKPKVIVALGNTPARILTGQNGITKWRGSVLECILVPGLKVYLAYHPSFVMRQMQERGEGKKFERNVYPTFVNDLKRAASLVDVEGMPYRKRDLRQVKHTQELVSYIKAIPKGTPVACDIEAIRTPSPNPPIVTHIGLSADPDNGVSLPLLDGHAFRWTLDELAYMFTELSELFLSGNPIIFHNGFYDAAVLGYLFGFRFANIHDTMMMHHVCYPNAPKGLAYISSCYTWERYWKDDRSAAITGAKTYQTSIYNARDCAVTKELHSILTTEVRENGCWKSMETGFSLYPSLLYMSLRGVQVDQTKLEDLNKTLTKKRDEAQAKIWEITGYEVNVNSPKQLQELLYHKMRFPVQTTRGKEKKITTNAEAMAKLERKTGHEIFALIRKFRKYSKLVGTYANVPVGLDGRMRSTYDPTGTVTLRLSSYESNVGGGTNLQNQPKRDEEGRQIRSVYVADEGKYMIEADLEQAEDRYVVTKAGDEVALERYRSGVDGHWANAHDIAKHLGVELPEEFDSHDEHCYKWRNIIAKKAKHAGNYDEGPYQFHADLAKEGVHLEFGEVKNLQAAQRAATPAIQMWKAWVRDQIRTHGTIYTPLGDKRTFLGRVTDDMFKKAYAQEPQSTIGRLMSIMIRDLHKELTGTNGWEPLMNVHDSIICQVNKEDLDWAIREMNRIMTIPLMVTDIFGVKRELIIPVEFKYGENWLEMEKYKL